MKNWRRFAESGYSLDDPLMRRLWRVSRILNNCNPFGEDLKTLNMVQMDFIIRMYAQDHPDELKITDKDIAKGEGPTQIWAEWDNVLRGKTKGEFGRSPIVYLRNHFGWEKKK